MNNTFYSEAPYLVWNNMLTLDAQITSYGSSERELLYKHLEKVKKEDLLLLDRGYPSIALIFLLKTKGIQFCMRMKDNWWLNMKEFLESGKPYQIVSFRLPKKDRHLLKNFSGMI